ncbi:MAG: aromatic-L-amino-acid/L-tryptophan decarboxylase, partial [Ilumatobacteraceae bacterium]
DGVEPVQEMIREQVRLTQMLAELVDADARFEVVAPHCLNLLCLAVRDGDAATDRLIEDANATGSVLFTRTVLDGRSVLRFSIGARATEERHVRAAWSLLQKLA